MKLIYLLTICLFISCATETKPLDPCLMDAGIKTAKSFDKDNPVGEKTKKYMLVEYDVEGNTLKVTNTIRQSTSDFVYDGENLKYVIVTSPNSDFYMEGKEKNIATDMNKDTLFITKNDDKGRKLEAMTSEDTNYKFSYVGCTEESTSIFDAEGVKQNSMRLRKENGNIIERTTTFYVPVESSVISKYLNYKFDSYGHWIERSLQRPNGNIETEIRVLEYY